jgi:uncharacterized membrane protein YecN with MAPEG domain
MLIRSGFTICFLTILLTGLSLNISRLRIRHRVSYGHADHRDMEVAVRAHGNCLEQTLLFVLLLVIAELLQSPGQVLAVLAMVFAATRSLHAKSPTSSACWCNWPAAL